MKKFLRSHVLLTTAIALIGISVLVWIATRSDTPTWTTTTVDQGTVRNIISVSGAVDAIDTADLAFPTGGILESLNAKEGDTVTKGQLLATLVHADLRADAQDAYAGLQIAEANRNELVNGISTEERNVSKTTLEIATADLNRTRDEQNDRVENAYRTLLSSNLQVRPLKNDNADIPPTVSGTYTCDEGSYTLELFKSNARSGYSYKLSGIENGTYSAFTESSAPLGTCGLSIQFEANESYGNSTWIIDIPNKQSTLYVTNLNAYNLALTQRTNAIKEAEQKLTLAEQNNTLNIATPREELLVRADAQVLQAQARVAAVNAKIQDRTLMAPFDGTITNIEPVVGESVGTGPIITMVSNNAFALTALIPEIDITKLRIGQKADIIFDARQEETLAASIVFISPLAKEIDGVSYFEAKLVLDETVDWLRSGLNADIDIIMESHETVTRIPKRFLVEENGSSHVLVPDNDKTKNVPVTIVFEGNDGYVQINGVNVGDTVVAP